MKWGFVLGLVLIAMTACGGGGGDTASPDPTAPEESGDDGGGGVPEDDGGYGTAPATDYVHVYNIFGIDDPIDPLEDELVTLDDGSVWEVTLYDYRLFMWRDFQDVVVCGLDMFNLDREESVRVFWRGGPLAETCPTLNRAGYSGDSVC